MYRIVPATNSFSQIFESKERAIEMLHADVATIESIHENDEEDSVLLKRIIDTDDRVVLLIHNSTIDEVIVLDWVVYEKELY
jgi:hypothetical protein